MGVNCCTETPCIPVVTNNICVEYSAACGDAVIVFDAADFFPSGVVSVTSITDCGAGTGVTITREDGTSIVTAIALSGSSISTTVNNIASIAITCNPGTGNGCTGKVCIGANFAFPTTTI